MKLKYKTSIVMIVFGIVILLVISLVFDFQSRRIVIDRELNRLKGISQEVSLHIDSNLFDNIQIAQTISTPPLIKNALKDSNAEFSLLSDQEQEEQINILNERWKETSDIKNEFIQQHMTNTVAEYLKSQQIIIPGKYGEIFLTNRYGVMIATTAKLTTLSHANKYWWQAAYNEGKGKIFLDDRGYDNSAEGYVIGIVIPIMDNNELIGILKCNINIMSSLTEVVQNYSNRNPGKMQIVRVGGLVLCEKDVKPLSININEKILENLSSESSESIIISKNRQKTLIANSPIKITMGFDDIGFGGSSGSIDHIQGKTGEGWHVVLYLENEVALEAEHKLSQIIIVTGIIMTIIASFFALFLSKLAIKNIINVSLTAKEFGKGNLDIRSTISSHDEIGSLSQNFNDMAENLQKTMARRDELIAEIAKRKIVEEELMIISTTDELTGAYNRRAFNDNLKINIFRAKRLKEPLSMLLLDIDSFKTLNDCYGHDVGDLILIALVPIISKNIRMEDTIARWGGDEFTVLLPQTGKDEATLLAQSAREKISNFSFTNNIHVTVSIGLTELLSNDSENSFMKRTDAALYKAKESGKNMVISL